VIWFLFFVQLLIVSKDLYSWRTHDTLCHSHVKVLLHAARSHHRHAERKKVIVKIGFNNNKNNNILLGLNEFIRNLLTHKPAHCTQRYKNVIHTLHTASGVIEIFFVDINLSKSKLKTHVIITRYVYSIYIWCTHVYV